MKIHQTYKMLSISLIASAVLVGCGSSDNTNSQVNVSEYLSLSTLPTLNILLLC
ncbi:MAG: hypothetical protein Q9M36_04155 [Sulfurovum sp.]|nr:hypothetical protein [Sulfurovum sp.]